MLPTHFISFPRQNRWCLWTLVGMACIWSLFAVALNWLGGFVAANRWLDALWMAVQLIAAAQLFLPVQHLVPEPRRRSFYWFWLLILIVVSCGLHLLVPVAGSIAVGSAIQSGFLLFSGTLVGAVLARYINRLRDLVLVSIVMSLADFSSWLAGPTAQFAGQIAAYYQAPQGEPPIIDMILIKLALPGSEALIPVIGVSDWVMVSFFACVASRFHVNENLTGAAVKHQSSVFSQIGRYLPLPVVVLFSVILLAHNSQLFIPVLPLLAFAMITWYVLKTCGRHSEP